MARLDAFAPSFIHNLQGLRTSSLIYQFFVLVYTFHQSRAQCAVLGDVHGAVENLLQFANHGGMFQQTDTSIVILNE